MRSGLLLVVVLLAAASAYFLFFNDPAEQGTGAPDVGETPVTTPGEENAPSLKASGSTRARVPNAIRGRGMLQGMTRRAGEGVAADVELRHVVEIDPKNPFQGGFERMFIERMLDSGLSSKAVIARTTAGADGRFKFKGLAPGLYEVRALGADGAIGMVSAMLPALGARVEVNVDLPDGDKSLKGRVLYADDKPYKGLVVATAGMEAMSAMMGGASARVRPAYTKDDGTFEISGLTAGRYQISAIIPGALRVMGAPIAVPHSGEYVLKINAVGVTVKGKVISAATEEPIAGATVFGGGGDPSTSFAIFSTKSKDDGTFEMTIPAGRGGGMFVRAKGYAAAMVQFRGGVDAEVVVSMLALGKLSGRVTAQAGGEPVKGTTVFAMGTGRGMGFGGNLNAAVTDADGRYAFDGVAPGAVKIHAIGGGWASVGLTGTGLGETNTPYVAEIEPGGSAEKDLHVQPSGIVKGRAVDVSGRPVPGAVVQAGGPRDITQMITAMMGMGVSFANDVTDSEGYFEIDALVPGTKYKLAGKAPEHPDAASEPFTAESGKTASMDITFPESRWIDVRVVNAAGGQPVSGATVGARPKTSDSPNIGDITGFFGSGTSWTTDGEGKARVGPLQGGAYEVQAVAAGYILSKQDLGEDEKGTITIELQKGLVISGTIQVPPGIPAQSVRITVQRDMSMGEEWFHERAAVAADGTWRVDNIKSAGEYKVSARGDWQEKRFKGEMRVDAGTTDVVLELSVEEAEESQQFDVIVTDADGKLVPSGRVQMTKWSGNGSSSTRVRLNNGKALFRNFDTSGELWVEVFELVGSSRAATIQGPVTVSGGKLEIRLPRPQVIAGQVTGPDGKGVAGVKVEAAVKHPRGGDDEYGRTHGAAVSDGDGRFTIKGLGPHEYRLSSTAPRDYAPIESQEARAGDQQVAITATMGAKAVLTLLDYAGKPVAGANVHLQKVQKDASASASGSRPVTNWRSFGGEERQSDGEGIVTLRGIEPGAAWDVTINVPQNRKDLMVIKLKAWEPADGTHTFKRGYAIDGTIVAKGGKPAKRVNLRYRKVGETSWKWGNVKDDGTFAIGQLESGRYQLKPVPQGMHNVARPRAPGEPAPPEPEYQTVRAGAQNVRVIADLGATLEVKVAGMSRSGSRNRHRRSAHLTMSDGKGGMSGMLQGEWTRYDTLEFRGLKTDATYRLWIGGLPGGKYVQRDGVRAQDAALNVTPKVGGKITGRVKLPEGAGEVRNISVNANTKDGVGHSANVDMKTMTFTLDGLPEATEWSLNVWAWGDGQSYQGQGKASTGGSVEIELKKR